MFSVKGQRVNILGFMNHTVSVETLPLCYYSTEEAIDNVSIICVLIKFVALKFEFHINFTFYVILFLLFVLFLPH